MLKGETKGHPYTSATSGLLNSQVGIKNNLCLFINCSIMEMYILAKSAFLYDGFRHNIWEHNINLKGGW